MISQELLNSDLGINVHVLYDNIIDRKNSVFVDLGVRFGSSSEVMLVGSDENNNRVFGIDVDFSNLKDDIKKNKNYTKILGDSVTTGKNWFGYVDVLFIDTFHIKEQVLSELYFWYPHMREGGSIFFHDTNWPEDKFDFYGGINWPRVEDAIKGFFKTEELNYEDEYIKISNFPESWGMTVVDIKKKKNYISEYKEWGEIFKRRNLLINLFWNEDNKKNLDIDLSIRVQ